MPNETISITSEQKWATLWTIVVCGALVLALLYCTLSMQRPLVSENEIEIAFGDGADGMPAPEESQQPSAPTPTPVSINNPSADEPLLTAEDPSVVAARQETLRKRREEQRQQQILRQQQLEAQRTEQARIAAEQKAAAERQAKTDKANSLAAGAFGAGGNNAQGNGPGGGGTSTTPGNPLGRGSGNIDGSSWSLAGRDITKWSKPPYVGNQEGRVIVQITVNPQGVVIGADIKLLGTTITDNDIREACKNAARKARFTTTSRSGNAIGTITYTFVQQ